MNLQPPAPRSEGPPPVPRTLQMIERNVAATGAEMQVSSVLYEAVLEAVRFGPRDLPRSSDQEWIRGAMAVPVQEAVQQTMRGLCAELVRVLENAPDRLLDRLASSHASADLGCD